MNDNRQLKISIIDATFNQLGFKALDIEQLDLIFHLVDALRELEALSIDARLSDCEQVCLYWSAKGLLPEEIAVLQRNKTNLVYDDQRNILAKLNCKTVAQAVFVGIKWCEFTKNEEKSFKASR